MSCSARIRPFRPVNDVELVCDNLAGHDGGHSAVLLDYSHPGSRTVISWMAGDRRTFHGEWPGGCDDGLRGCILPHGHPGGCAP